ncbi:MAG: HDOD domain-containing protein, partial [Deltaproteobacteria bacterium]|nr:HDOD domain-containing protein [Deltaproteobacteria bacterium]
ACREISRKGYLLALDDFTYTEEMEPLIELADIIKFDFRLSSVEEIRAYLSKLAGHKVKLLAEKVETSEELEELFQGYFFCKPEVIQGQDIGASQLVQLQIMAEINKDDFDFNQVEELVSSDVGISYKLLRYINSPYFARPGKIEAIKQALVYMGADEMRRFISLMAITNLAADKPRELINLSCIRGKFCELLGRQSRYQFKPSMLFTVGMFSLMDAIMDQPMAKIMEKLPLAEDLVKALVARKGVLAGFLVLVIAYEQGRWTAVRKVARKLGIDEAVIPALYAEACDWNNQVAAAV